MWLGVALGLSPVFRILKHIICWPFVLMQRIDWRYAFDWMAYIAKKIAPFLLTLLTITALMFITEVQFGNRPQVSKPATTIPAVVPPPHRPPTVKPGFLLIRPFPWSRVSLRAEGKQIAQWNAPHIEPKPLPPGGPYELILKFADGHIEKTVL